MNKSSIIKQFLLPILCFLNFLACSKGDDEIKIQRYYAIEGTIRINDYYTGSAGIPLSNAGVKIRTATGAATDTSTFFATATTNSSGRYIFYITDTTVAYEMFVLQNKKSSSVFNPLYFGWKNTGAPVLPGVNYDLTLSVDEVHFNGLNIRTTDINNLPIANCQVSLYFSPDVAAKDTTFSGVGSYLKLMTDSLGKAFVSPLPVQTFYINANLRLNGNNNLKLVATPVTLRSTGIETQTLKLF